MDLTLRSRLLCSLVGVVMLCETLTIAAGVVLINRMVIGEAQRRVQLALKTSHAMLERRLEEAKKSIAILSGDPLAEAFQKGGPVQDLERLRELREKCGVDFLQVLDNRGKVLAATEPEALGTPATVSPVVRRVIESRQAASGVSRIPLESLERDAASRVERTRVDPLPTPHAKPGGARELTGALVLEVVLPVQDHAGNLAGAVRVGTVLNRNFDFVDFVRDNIFTAASYDGKNLGTVTIFQDDVRITTNVIGPDGERAVGTRVSAEVYEQVLEQGRTWTGPAFVVDSWYISAYEPLRDIDGNTVGMLYVGVLKKRYDDMRRNAMNLFLFIGLLACAAAVGLSFWLASRTTRPLTRLTAGVAEVTRGNLSYRLPAPMHARRDEIRRLTSDFNQMVSSLMERNEQLHRSRDDLQRTANELHQWVQNYLEALEFITHELKNQVAAMKINLLAVRDGYLGPIAENQQEALDDVHQAIHRAEEMILNYLNLSRIEKGELQVRARPVHVEADVLRPVLNNLRGRLDARQMQVEIRLPEDLLVQADPALLEIVYENLLTNAVKYGRTQGRVRVSGKRSNDMAELHVWNDGPGVPPDQSGNLFVKFFRLQPSAGEERGTGLGLFITREILLRHGGSIRAESSFGEWIDFVFFLPVPDGLLSAEPDPGKGSLA
jgi:two-component system, NtrC family, sensor kinase